MAAATKKFNEKEKVPLSFLVSSDLYSQMPQGEVKARRRKKDKGIGDGETRTAEERKKRRLRDEQVNFLEMKFEEERKLDSSRKVHLATVLGIDPKQVSVWFQNRRARWKSKQLEDEYVRLRSSHDAVLIEKCRLENEILKLRDKLVKSEEEIKRLGSFPKGGGGESAGGASPNSLLLEEAHATYATTSFADNYYYMMESGLLFGL
ncbi:hypothetical protein HPP92_024161 [Vanilla planifolia]|uniref:Homeobox-leucine zipper protein n=1 Tax=Vanilla planifolia TaxID=51239 RepID=A0A835PS74_VANPL|nr:hypothetical protein HPP92_024494 [Vanilla planifolia]KAG0456373.1 hypothetical protein HPP92_024161 [Vanilla planifolia]